MVSLAFVYRVQEDAIWTIIITPRHSILRTRCNDFVWCEMRRLHFTSKQHISHISHSLSRQRSLLIQIRLVALAHNDFVIWLKFICLLTHCGARSIDVQRGTNDGDGGDNDGIEKNECNRVMKCVEMGRITDTAIAGADEKREKQNSGDTATVTAH